jgi:hypothetical protein
LLPATALMDDYVLRNEVARKPHAEAWQAKHRGDIILRLSN